MNRPNKKYALDTNLFITAFRQRAANDELQQFHRLFAPFEYLSAVVAHELRTGARTPGIRQALERNVLSPFVLRGRVVTPSFDAWQEAGDILAKMATREGRKQVSRGFGNDVLLALSCRESGLTLITDNRRDLERIGRYVRFRFMEPWPAPLT